MCGGVLFSVNGEEQRVFFPNPSAVLPVLKKNGAVETLAWGRRKEQKGNMPLGGWARLESIRGGRWDRYFPRPVKLPVQSFMEKDHEGKSHWYPLKKGDWLQGLLATDGHIQRVYVVTIEPEMPDAIHNRWPRVMSA